MRNVTGISANPKDLQESYYYSSQFRERRMSQKFRMDGVYPITVKGNIKHFFRPHQKV